MLFVNGAYVPKLLTSPPANIRVGIIIKECPLTVVGPQGAQGPSGTDEDGGGGPQGYQGVAGAQGNQGYQGASVAGPQGYQGVAGAQGYQGVVGTQGFQGVVGSNGAIGLQGSAGAQGEGVPTGGTTRQFLAKASGSDYDDEWTDIEISDVVGLQDVLDSLQSLPPEIYDEQVVNFTSIKGSGSISITCYATAGYYKVLWWDETITNHASGVAATKAVSNADPKDILVWPSSLAGNEVYGTLTGFVSNSNSITTINITPAISLSGLTLSSDEELVDIADIIGLPEHPSLTTLTMIGSELVSFELNNPVLGTLVVTSSDLLEIIDLQNCPNVSVLTCTNCSVLAELSILGTAIVNQTISGCPLTIFYFDSTLQYLTINGSLLTELDLSSSGVIELYLTDCIIETFIKNPDLQAVSIANLDALESVDLSDCEVLSNLDIISCNILEEVIVSDCSALASFSIYGNSALTSIRAENCVLSAGYQQTNTNYNTNQNTTTSGTTTTTTTTTTIQNIVGTIITSNALNGAALNIFYSDLGDTTGDIGIIDITGNPGTGTDNPFIATVKNYVIVGT